ncbi:peptidoglycan D,D-transpeptidase FtsI family protein [Demequina aurantiaca]|uniref:peptidoglycan D,D-transpeptidase FtsI family protein n=1 Tax=Demequina aurantiaca TaxID=676200 RepID=UPI000B0C5650|nr:penicillin-binding protein 2 [Demequina aurantiaca]
MASAQRSVAPTVGKPVKRQRILAVLLLALLVVFAGRLVLVQGVQAAELSEEALASRLVTTEVDSERADIVDRNGVVLATSVKRYNVGVNQKLIAQFKRTENQQVVAEGPLDAAKILAPILGLKESELAAQMVGDSTFKYIAKDITPETWELIQDENIYGIEPEPTSERIYPNGDIAGNVVGFVAGSADGPGERGAAGTELEYEDELLGKPGSITYEKGGGGTIIPTGTHEETPAVPGSTVVLTLDRDIQWQTQKLVEAAVKKTGTERAMVTVEDVQTGEILALVDSGSVDPNDPGATKADARGARTVSTVFEPGSTGKVITMAAALEEGVATPLSEYKAPYKYTTPNNQTFHDSHDSGTQKLTLAGVLVHSSNTGTVQIGEKLSQETRYKYLTAFGFGEPTNVGLPDESGGILHPWEEWDGRTKYAVLYGQGVSVTALQTAQVYQTVANGGVRLQPTIVKGLQHPDGTFTPRELDEPTRVVSEKTASELMLMLEDVTEDGTGKNAQIEGYRVAGKTGTAQAADASGKLTKIIASFVGVAPADNPRIVVSVIMYEPKTSIYGGEVAAPLFKDVSTFALQALRVPPSGTPAKLYPTTWE